KTCPARRSSLGCERGSEKNTKHLSARTLFSASLLPHHSSYPVIHPAPVPGSAIPPPPSPQATSTVAGAGKHGKHGIAVEDHGDDDNDDNINEGAVPALAPRYSWGSRPCPRSQDSAHADSAFVAAQLA